jgi:serine protease Do
MTHIRSKSSLLAMLAMLLVAMLALTACPGGTPAPEVAPTEEPAAAPTPEPEPTAEPTPEPEPTVEPTPTEAAGSIEDVQAATVQVIVQGSQYLEEFVGTGSGVIYDPSGLVITNNHVVEGAAIVQVKLDGQNSPVSARVLGKSPCDDLAVLQISGSDFPYAELGGDIRVGDDVFAIGYPLGIATQSTTKGIVSKMDVPVATGFADYLRAIQTDAAINPGNSGGPLVTRDGKVIGINSAGFSADVAQGTNFAVSMAYARPIIDRLAQGEKIGWIGVNAAPLPADLAASFGIAVEPGLFVYAIDSGSPADRIGIQEGDFITAVEGISVGADGTLKSYCDVLRSHTSEDVLDVSVIRSGARLAGQINGRELEGGTSIAVGENTEPTPSSSSGGSGDAIPVNFVDYEDDTGRIRLQLPDVWEVATSDLVLHGSVDLDGWFESYGGTSEGAATTPGFYIQALDRDSTVDMNGVEEFLDNSTGIPENCEFDASARGDYNDGIYQGRYDIMPCDQGEYVTLVAFDPANPSFLIWIEAYVITGEDTDIFSNALDTFYVDR